MHLSRARLRKATSRNLVGGGHMSWSRSQNKPAVLRWKEAAPVNASVPAVLLAVPSKWGVWGALTSCRPGTGPRSHSVATPLILGFPQGLHRAPRPLLGDVGLLSSDSHVTVIEHAILSSLWLAVHSFRSDVSFYSWSELCRGVPRCHGQ